LILYLQNKVGRVSGESLGYGAEMAIMQISQQISGILNVEQLLRFHGFSTIRDEPTREQEQGNFRVHGSIVKHEIDAVNEKYQSELNATVAFIFINNQQSFQIITNISSQCQTRPA